MMSPPERSRFWRIRSGNTRIPSASMISRSRTSPVMTHAASMARPPMFVMARSASCSACIPSRASGTFERICAPSVMMSWLNFGFRFCGIVLLPTVPGETGSSTSPNSSFISVKISRAILVAVEENIARTRTYSASWSRITREGTGIERRSRRSASRSCTCIPCSPNEATVPAPPPSMATKRRGSQARRRSTCRQISSIQLATFRPNVAGTACCPCVRPGSRWSRVRSARFASASNRCASRSRMIACTCRSWRISPVWVMFCVVAPQWTNPPASPSQTRSSSQISGTSGCPVTRSPSSIAGMSRRDNWHFVAISSAASRGMIPRSASAAARAASTSSQACQRASRAKSARIPGSGTRSSVARSCISILSRSRPTRGIVGQLCTRSGRDVTRTDEGHQSVPLVSYSPRTESR